MSESCAPTSEEESSDEENSDDDDKEGDEFKSLRVDGGEETSEKVSCDKLTAVKPENIYENDEK